MYKVIEEDAIDISGLKPKYKLILKILNFTTIVAHFYARIDAENVALLLNKQRWNERKS